VGKLSGKIAIITGAAAGMGVAHAQLFAEEGARLVLTDIDEQAGIKVASAIGADAIFIKHDVVDPGAWDAVVAEAERVFGPVTILVNNAGIAGPRCLAAELDPEDYLRIMAINANGTFFGMRAVLPGMVRASGGSIVNISSTAGFSHTKYTGNMAYTASKFAVRGMTRAASVEYAGQNIRINSVHPGGVLTSMVANNLPDDAKQAILAEIPMGRLAEPSEISKLVLFLASDDSSYITGSAMVADGGLLR
jgi:3alpha(or 20beta)-hydroxysteroid dehydrogenase